MSILAAATQPSLPPPRLMIAVGFGISIVILGVAYAKAVWSSYKTRGYFEPTAGIRWNGGQIVDWITTTYS